MVFCYRSLRTKRILCSGQGCSSCLRHCYTDTHTRNEPAITGERFGRTVQQKMGPVEPNGLAPLQSLIK